VLRYAVGLLFSVLVGACDSGTASGISGAGASPREGPVKVLATTGMIGDIARRVAGPHARVESLMGPGVDPHLYKPSEGDVRRLGEADLILYNGLNLEGKMGDIFVSLARRGRSVLAVTETIPRDKLREPPEFLGHYDPHVWFDVSLWALTIRPIARELAALDPVHSSDFDRNAAALEEELKVLDLEVEKRIAEIPEPQRVLVTAHDAFGYFGRRYRIEVVGLQGISTVAEAGLRDVERLTDAIVARKVKAIFIESSVSPRAIEAVQKACESRGHKVVIGGQLFSDAMGAAGTMEGTYPGMVRHNVKTIVEALR